MKKVLLAGAAAIFSGHAIAAPPSVPVTRWTGCYIGAHAGAGWSHSDFSDQTFTNIAPVLGETVSANGNAGFVGGAQLGCDYQFATNWVLGLAGDFSWADISHDEVDPFFGGKNPAYPETIHARTRSLASVTGRLGYGWDRFLVYVKGGPAWAREEYAVNNFACVIFVACYTSTETTRSGWAAGGGIEWAFTPNWSVLVEYSHYGFGTNGYTFVDRITGTPVGFNVKQDVDVVRLGINYRFGVPFR